MPTRIPITHIGSGDENNPRVGQLFHDVDSNRIKKYHDGVITDIDRFNIGDYRTERGYSLEDTPKTLKYSVVNKTGLTYEAPYTLSKTKDLIQKITVTTGSGELLGGATVGLCEEIATNPLVSYGLGIKWLGPGYTPGYAITGNSISLLNECGTSYAKDLLLIPEMLYSPQVFYFLVSYSREEIALYSEIYGLIDVTSISNGMNKTHKPFYLNINTISTINECLFYEVDGDLPPFENINKTVDITDIIKHSNSYNEIYLPEGYFATKEPIVLTQNTKISGPGYIVPSGLAGIKSKPPVYSFPFSNIEFTSQTPEFAATKDLLIYIRVGGTNGRFTVEFRNPAGTEVPYSYGFGYNWADPEESDGTDVSILKEDGTKELITSIPDMLTEPIDFVIWLDRRQNKIWLYKDYINIGQISITDTSKVSAGYDVVMKNHATPNAVHFIKAFYPDIMILGDSITALGMPWYTGTYDMVSTIRTELKKYGFENWFIVNKGIGAQSSSQFIVRLSEIYENEPQFCFLQCSNNDFSSKYDYGVRAGMIQTMINFLTVNNVKVLLMNSIVPNENHSLAPEITTYHLEWDLQYFQKKVFTDVNAYLDINSVVALPNGVSDPSLVPDGIHPSEDARVLISDYMKRQLSLFYGNNIELSLTECGVSNCFKLLSGENNSINIAPSVKGLSTVRVKVPEEYSLPRIVIENNRQIIYDNPNTSETFLNEWHNIGDVCRDLTADPLTIAEYVCVESGRPGVWKNITFAT